MVFINIYIKSENTLCSNDTNNLHILIDNDKTVSNFFNILIKEDAMAKYNAYMFNNKCLGYEIPMNKCLYEIFGTSLSITLKEVSFIVPMNPLKRVNWLILMHQKNLFDIINLNDDELINKQSIGTWHSWGKLPNNIPENMDNHPENLVVIIERNQKWAYNKHQLRELLEVSKTETVLLPHNTTRHDKIKLITDLDNVFGEKLPIIKL